MYLEKEDSGATRIAASYSSFLPSEFEFSEINNDLPEKISRKFKFFYPQIN